MSDWLSQVPSALAGAAYLLCFFGAALEFTTLPRAARRRAGRVGAGWALLGLGGCAGALALSRAPGAALGFLAGQAGLLLMGGLGVAVFLGAARGDGEDALSGSTQGGRRRAAEGALLAGAMLAWSALWLWLTVGPSGAGFHPRLLERVAGPPGLGPWAMGLLNLTGLLLAPVLEECVWRGYAQGWLERRGRRALALWLPAALWALQHGTSLDPAWVKWGQIFGLGLLLGLARRRLGLAGAVLLHLLFNLHGFVPGLEALLPPALRG